MAQYTIAYYTVSVTLNAGGAPVLGGNLGQGQSPSTGSEAVGDRFVVNTPATQTIVIEDNDTSFSDGDIANTTTGQYVVGGTYNGQPAQLEYSLQVQAVVGGVPTGPLITVYALNVGGTFGTGAGSGAGTGLGFVAAPGALQVGVTYQVISAGDFPAIDAPQFEDLACFTHGTVIETVDGPVAIETLSEGDLVTTLDNGSQPVRWIGTRKVSVVEMMANPALRPILFEAGSIGNDRDLIVSPQHRMLLNDWRAQVYFGEDEVLIAAKALVNGKTIRQIMPQDGVTYCHLLFDHHEILIAEGALSESFHPGAAGVDALSGDQQRELEMLFPELAEGLPVRETAYPVVKPADVRGLVLTN